MKLFSVMGVTEVKVTHQNLTDLKKPNIIHENITSFIQDFPHEIGLGQYIDHDLQFDKSFLEPLKIILDAIEWNVEKTVNLELFFS